MNFYVGECGCPIPGGPAYYTVCPKHDDTVCPQQDAGGLQVPPAEHPTASTSEINRASTSESTGPPPRRPRPVAG